MTSTGSPSRRTLLGSALASGAVVTTGLALSTAADAATDGRPDDHPTGHPADRSRDQRAAGSAGSRSGGRVVTGAEVAAADDWAVLRGTKLGIFSNPTGILPDARHIVDDLAEHDDLTIVGAFGPEHGFRGSAQAGGSEGDSRDPRTGIPVYDAYGANQAKLGQLFTKAGVETLVFDIQDIGARFYTYIWTLYNSMAAAARLGIRYVVLDRPNPIGGRVDGAMMTPGYTSGVGAKEIVQQHGMTVGELARFFNGELLPAEAGRPVDLEVVEVRGWRPDSRAQEYDPLWPPPSPNVPTPDTALAYVGTCFFEGTNISEGRGTTRPFELVGAPYLDCHWGDRLNTHGLPGVEFREAYFVPTFNKYADETCAGVQVHVTDVRAFAPIPAAVAMLVEAHRYADFQWRYDTYDPKRPYWIDKLSGSPRLRTMIDAGASVAEVVGAWSAEVKEFDTRRRQYLLYPGRRA